MTNHKHGDIIPIDQLNAGQQLQVIEMIEEKVDRSENRVLAAIAELKADLKSEITAVKAEIKAVRDDLKADIKAVNGRVDSLKTLVISMLMTMLVAHVGIVVWILDRVFSTG